METLSKIPDMTSPARSRRAIRLAYQHRPLQSAAATAAGADGTGGQEAMEPALGGAAGSTQGGTTSPGPGAVTEGGGGGGDEAVGESGSSGVLPPIHRLPFRATSNTTLSTSPLTPPPEPGRAWHRTDGTRDRLAPGPSRARRPRLKAAEPTSTEKPRTVCTRFPLAHPPLFAISNRASRLSSPPYQVSGAQTRRVKLPLAVLSKLPKYSLCL